MVKRLFMVFLSTIFLSSCKSEWQKGENGKRALSISYSSRNVHLDRKTAAFISTHPEIEVTVVYNDLIDESGSINENHTGVYTALLSGTATDVFEIPPAKRYEFGRSGYIANIYDLMDEDELFNIEDYNEHVFKAMEVDGMLVTYTDTFNILCSALNDRYYDGAGVLFESLNKVTLEDMFRLYSLVANTRGIYIEPSIDYYFLYAGTQNYVDIEGKKTSFDSPEFLNFLNIYKNVRDQSIDIEKLGLTNFSDWSTVHNYFFLNISDSNRSFYLPEEEPFAALEPAPNKNFFSYKPFTNQKGQVYLNCDAYLSINESSKNKETAWQYLKFISSEEGAAVGLGLGLGLGDDEERFGGDFGHNHIKKSVNEQMLWSNYYAYLQTLGTDMGIDEQRAVRQAVYTLLRYQDMPMVLLENPMAEEFKPIICKYVDGVIDAEQATKDLDHAALNFLGE